MRVLHVTHQYPPAVGGSEKYIADLSEELARRGHHVDVFTTRSLDYNTWKNELAPHERLNDVEIYRFRSMRRTWWVWKILHWSLYKYWRNRSRWYEPFILFGGGPISLGMLASFLSRLPQYDLVHLNCLVYSQVTYGYWAARSRHVPIVVTPHLHIDQEVSYGLKHQLEVLRGSDHVIAVSEAEREFLLRLGLDPLRVTTAGNGLELSLYPLRDKFACRQRLGIPREAFVMLFLGRQVKYKGIAPTLNAFITLKAQHPSLYFLIIGPETDYSRELFSHYSGLSGISNLGLVSDDVRIDALNACDCLVLPSEGEAFGIVFLEAWAMSKPVIGPRLATVATVVRDGQDGWLVPLGDSQAIVNALKSWIDSPELARQMGESGHTRLLNCYTRKNIADVVEGVYLRTLRANSVCGDYKGEVR